MLFCYELFYFILGFIFQYVKLSFESSVLRYLEDVGIGIFDISFSWVQYRFVRDGIYVKIR